MGIEELSNSSISTWNMDIQELNKKEEGVIIRTRMEKSEKEKIMHIEGVWTINNFYIMRLKSLTTYVADDVINLTLNKLERKYRETKRTKYSNRFLENIYNALNSIHFDENAILTELYKSDDTSNPQDLNPVDNKRGLDGLSFQKKIRTMILAERLFGNGKVALNNGLFAAVRGKGEAGELSKLNLKGKRFGRLLKSSKLKETTEEAGSATLFNIMKMTIGNKFRNKKKSSFKKRKRHFKDDSSDDDLIDDIDSTTNSLAKLNFKQTTDYAEWFAPVVVNIFNRTFIQKSNIKKFFVKNLSV